MASTVASLERARARQRTVLRALPPLVAFIAVFVEIGGATGHPGPGLHGEHLAVLIGLIGFGGAILAMLRSRPSARVASAVFLVVVVASSALLVNVQPSGPASLGAFVAVAAAAMRLPRLGGAAIAAFAMVALPVAGLVGAGRPVQAILLNEIGVLAFYIVALLADRLRESQEQTEDLLRELLESRELQARSAVLAERQRLAREMHDVLAHSLSAMALQLEGGRLLAETKGADPELAGAFERAHRLAKTGLDEARRAIGLLRDEELPGPDGVPQLVTDFERDTDISTSLRVIGQPWGLAPDARLTLYRVAQEALTNVRKHSRGTSVEVRLGYESSGTRLTVEDFGAEPCAIRTLGQRGYGLTGMRERAELMGGSLTARQTDTGFRVELWIPN